ncbi:MAG TPA: penicillin-binding protein activator, partial [Cellvibrionaceae bacterium]
MSIRILAALVISLAVLIAGCGTQPTEPSEAMESDAPLSLSELERRIGTLLEQAGNLPSPEREQQLLSAAELLNQNRQPDWALNILQSIPTAALDDEAFIRYSDQVSRAAIATGRYLLARELLTDDRLRSLSLPASLDITLSERRATVDSRLGNFSDALNERIHLGERLSESDDIELNNESIWQDLMSLSPAQLQTLADAPAHSPQLGWAELALLARDNASDLSAQLAQLQRWQRQWLGHPAARHLPTDLQLLNQLVAEQPRQVALLLPQQGRLAAAASAVRDGFLAAYYAAPLGAKRPDIRQYDTSGDNIVSVYQQAIDDGAEMIIGPLSKEHVQTLSMLPLAVPVLALNTLDDKTPEEQIFRPEQVLHQQLEPAP